MTTSTNLLSAYKVVWRADDASGVECGLAGRVDAAEIQLLEKSV